MNQDLTTGKPSRVLWKFCLPLFGSIIFQQLYNIADSFLLCIRKFNFLWLSAGFFLRYKYIVNHEYVRICLSAKEDVRHTR